MLTHRANFLAFLLAVAVTTAVGCHSNAPKPQPPAAPLRTATLEELMASFNQNANAIRTMSLKLDLTAQAGRKKYHFHTSYLLAEKPASLRLWSTAPLIGKVFDTASDGTQFELSVSLPTYNKFFIGRNNLIPANVTHPLEQMRPQVILNALLFNPIAPPRQAALDPATDGAEYDVLIVQPDENGMLRLARRITFSRYDLLPHKQMIYDSDGVHRTEATYEGYTVRQNIPVPTEIVITRPVEHYSLHMKLALDGITLNAPMPTPNPFELQPPPGVTVIRLSAVADQAGFDGGGYR